MVKYLVRPCSLIDDELRYHRYPKFYVQLRKEILEMYGFALATFVCKSNIYQLKRSEHKKKLLP